MCHLMLNFYTCIQYICNSLVHGKNSKYVRLLSKYKIDIKGTTNYIIHNVTGCQL